MRSTAFLLVLIGSLPARADDTFFQERIAPLLKERCLSCHNPDKSKGDLDLSSRVSLLKGGEEGSDVVPGKAEASLLLKLVSGPKPKMPRNADALTAAQIADLRRWIADGAPWPESLRLVPNQSQRSGADWWAWRPVVGPAVPKVRQTAWVRTPIDTFILAKLEEKGLTPAPEADRPTLIRRLTYDLHGLPPTPDEIDAFVNDAAPNAYEKLIDRLLASPRYGERWGRHWLDTVHYADTHGYDKDKRRPNAWPYRDYVIAAFNADTPYARFVREQLAGDVLYPGDPEGIIATGFITAGPWDFVGHVELREGTVDKEITRVLDRDDMVCNTASTFLSLTVGCARCHDHKFDPIAQKDYYRLQAVFSGVDRGDRPYRQTQLPAEQKAGLEKRRDEIGARRTELTKMQQSRSPELGRIEDEIKELKERLAALPPAPVGAPSKTNGWHSQIVGRPESLVWVQADLGKSLPIEEVRLYPARPTDFADTPGFGFPVRFKIELSDDATFAKAEVIDDHTRSDFPNPGDVPYVLRPREKTARYVRITANRFWRRLQDYVVAFAELEVESGGKNVAQGAKVTASESIEAGRWSTRHLVDGFTSRQQLPDLADPKTGPKARERLTVQSRLGNLERDRLLKIDAAADPKIKAELAALTTELARVEQQLLAPPPQLVYAPLPHAPRSIHVLHRGSVTAPRDTVSPGALAVVSGLESDFHLTRPTDEGSRRAALAEWIVDAQNPLTRRSLVNRVWHYHFGKGIVDTPNDFGFNGGRPTHPELLDWLAVEFLEKGESLKQLHRLILTSSVYRQASRPHAEHAKIDADNRLLWRMNRRRLDAESLRDAVLAVSGKLDLTMGGPGFDLFRFKDDHSPIYDYATFDKVEHPEANRRTIYRFAVRSVPNPFLECLDCADPNISTPVRNTTNTALQALALLNDPFMVRQAEHLAERLAKVTTDRTGQVQLAYRLALGRLPTAEEATALRTYAVRHGLPQMCRVLFNTNEFLFVD
jgi:hypothetical protein